MTTSKFQNGIRLGASEIELLPRSVKTFSPSPSSAKTEDPGGELVALAKERMSAHGEAYPAAFDRVCKEHPELRDRYLRSRGLLRREGPRQDAARELTVLAKEYCKLHTVNYCEAWHAVTAANSSLTKRYLGRL